MDSLQTNVPDGAPVNDRTRRQPSLIGRVLALIINWAPAVAVMSVIFMLSSKPDFGGPAWVSALIRDLLGEGPLLDRIEWLLPYADAYSSWIAHFVEYGALAVALYWGIRRQWPSIRRAALLAWGLVIVYALSDELHQGFVPGRHPDYRDILTDAAGAALALFLVVSLERFVRWKWGDDEMSQESGQV
jgi:VanZ family protein